MPERVDMWKGVIIIAIVALVLAALVGGAYLWYKFSSLSSGEGSDTASSTSALVTNQRMVQDALNQNTASSSDGASLEANQQAVRQSLSAPPASADTQAASQPKTLEDNQDAVQKALQGSQ